MAFPLWKAATNIARKQGVDPSLFRALIRQESGGRHYNTKGDPSSGVLGSSAGALGYAQLMPGTAAGLGVDPTKPRQNLQGGARYLARQLDKYDGNVRHALAAYNAGPGAVDKYGGIPPYAETQNYVKSVLALQKEYPGQGPAPTGGKTQQSPTDPVNYGLEQRPERADISQILSSVREGDLEGVIHGIREKRAFEESQHPATAIHAQQINENAQQAAQGEAARQAAGKGRLTPQGGNPNEHGVVEAFHDPLGQFDNGRFSDQGIGGHGQHVHVSFSTPAAALKGIRIAQSMGMRVGENPFTDPVDAVHVANSFHYQNFPGKYGKDKRTLGKAFDVTGTPEQMQKYYRLMTGA